MFARVVIGQGDTMYEYAWHYAWPPDKKIPIDEIGLKIGLFPTFEKALDYIKVDNKDTEFVDLNHKQILERNKP